MATSTNTTTAVRRVEDSNGRELGFWNTRSGALCSPNGVDFLAIARTEDEAVALLSERV